MKKRLILLTLMILLILIFFNSTYIVKNILEYTTLFINNLFVYTFIMYVISSMLIDYDLLEVLKPRSYITIMSILSGFPSGSKYICDLLKKEYISEEEANYLITYNHYPNPLFVIGSVSTILTKGIALKLLLSIYLGSFIISRLFRVKDGNKKRSSNTTISFTKSLSSAINNALKTIVLIYGTSIFSVIITLIITHIFSLNSLLYCITNGIFDLTKGIFSTVLIDDKRIRAILILLFINISSISIHMQVKTILDNSTIKYSNFLKGRILSTIVSIIVFLMLYSL